MLVYVEDNVDEFEQRWDRALLALSSSLHRAVEAAVDEGPREALATKRWHDETGLLSSMTKGYVLARVPGGALGEFGAYTYYASFVDGGTRPHEIWASAGSGFIGPVRQGQGRTAGGGHNSGGLLTFKTRDGNWVSVPMVHHPGTKADGFMGRGYLKAEAVMIREVEIGVAEMQRELDR